MIDIRESDTLVAQLERAYGIDVVGIEPLDGEVALNYRVLALGDTYMLKLVDASESAPTTSFQSSVLEWCGQSRGEIPTPRIIPSRDGSSTCEVLVEGSIRTARVTTFLPGDSSRETLRDDAQLRTFGALVARLDLALADFPHPVAPDPHPWDIYRPDAAIEMLAAATTVIGRSGLLSRLLIYREETLPELRQLPVQLIHNDLNRDNVLVADDVVTGILDFGDAVRSPRVVEIATAAAYFSRSKDPASFSASVLALVEGYHEEWPLSRRELAMIPELIAARCALAAAIALSRIPDLRSNPRQSAYVTRNTEASLTRLELVTEVSADLAHVLTRRSAGTS